MGINYNLVMKNRQRIPVEYVCYGLLNKLRNVTRGNINHLSPHFKIQKGENIAEVKESMVQSVARGKHSNLRAIELDYATWYKEYRSNNRFEGSCETYLEKMREVLELFPVIKSITTIHPKLRMVRVKTYKQPADKVLFCLSVARNLMKESEPDKQDLLTPYFEDRKKMYLFKWLVTTENLTDYSISPPTKYLRMTPTFSGEYSIFNANTFGKTALLNMYNDVEPQWVQGSLEESREGYMREYHYWKEGARCFGSATPQSLYLDPTDEYGYSRTVLPENIPASRYYVGKVLSLKLFDCLSVPNDTPIFSDVVWDDKVGFAYPKSKTLYVDHRGDIQTGSPIGAEERAQNYVNEFLSNFEE